MSRASSDFAHLPVLLAESLEALRIRPDGRYVDCTAGGGGHAAGILQRLGPQGRLIAIDRDPDALEASRRHFESLTTKADWRLRRANFRDFARVLREEGLERVDGVLADLGVSSHQLDRDERGFSFRRDGPLDMRMDPELALSAADLVNREKAERLIQILRDYGEERYARAIVAAIVRRRAIRPFTRTAELAELIAASVPAAARREKNPAKRSFQALRIAVNDELGALEALLDALPEHLAEGGRVCVITFHSLEDRMVKRRFRAWEQPCSCPRGLPCTCGRKPLGRCPLRQGVVVQAGENAANPRAHSARLRVFEFGSEGRAE